MATPTETTGPAPSQDQLHAPVSRRHAAIWNMVFSYATIGLVLARNLALVRTYINYIGMDEYSAWLVSGAVLMSLTSIDFGLTGVLAQQAAAAYGERNRDKLQSLIGTGLVLAVCIALLTGAISAALSPIIPRMIDVSPETGRRLTICFLIVAGTNAIQLVGYATGALLRSLQRSFFAGFFLVISELVALILTYWLVVKGWGLYAIAMGLVARSIIETGGTALTFAWVVFGVLKIRAVFRKSEIRSLASLSIYQFFTQIAARIKVSFDTFLIGAILNKETGGAYALTVKAHETVRLLSQGFGGAMAPAMAHLHGEKNTSRFKDITLLLFKLQTITGAIGFGGVIAFNKGFMSVWVGSGIYQGPGVNVLTAGAGFAYLLTCAAYEGIFSRGGFSTITKAVWTELVVRFALMVGLLATVGLIGAPLSSFATQVFLMLLPLTYILVKSLHFTRAEVVDLVGAVLRLTTGPMLLAVLALWIIPLPQGWFSLGSYAGLYVLACLAITWIIDRDFMTFILKRGRHHRS